jgi:hypothetical protein
LNMIRSPKDKSGVDQDLTFEEVCPVWFRKFEKDSIGEIDLCLPGILSIAW